MESGRTGILAFGSVDISILIPTTKFKFLVLDDVASNRRCFPFWKSDLTVLKIGFMLIKILQIFASSLLVDIRSSNYYMNISKERVRRL